MKPYVVYEEMANVEVFGLKHPIPPRAATMWASYRDGEVTFHKTEAEARSVGLNVEEVPSVSPTRSVKKYWENVTEAKNRAQYLWTMDLAASINFPGYGSDLLPLVRYARDSGHKWEEIPRVISILLDVIEEADFVHRSKI